MDCNAASAGKHTIYYAYLCVYAALEDHDTSYIFIVFLFFSCYYNEWIKLMEKTTIQRAFKDDWLMCAIGGKNRTTLDVSIWIFRYWLREYRQALLIWWYCSLIYCIKMWNRAIFGQCECLIFFSSHYASSGCSIFRRLCNRAGWISLDPKVCKYKAIIFMLAGMLEMNVWWKKVWYLSVERWGIFIWRG